MRTVLNKPFRIRSFVRRDSRKTPAQMHALQSDLPSFGFNIENGLFDSEKIFGRIAPLLLEIGFGSGESLLTLATTHPDKDFIGVETHRPGIGALLMGMKRNNINNIRIFAHDIIDVFDKSVVDNSLDGIQIFFPDPWQKRRHHPRRLIQPSFISIAISKLKLGSSLHLATDWEDYAKHMMRVLSNDNDLINVAGVNQFATRSVYRPILTKFERRAQKEGRLIWELQFVKGK